MGKKVYRSESIIGISVGRRRVSFIPLMRRGSLFITEDEDLQKGLESHPRFGSLFHLEREESEPLEEAVSEETSGEVSEESSGESLSEEAEVVRVSGAEDAREYLAERFGLSRTKLRYLKNIKEIAKEKGIVFEGLEGDVV